MFDSIYSNSTFTTVGQLSIMAAVALVSGFIYAFILSFRVRSTKRFFMVNAILPFVIGLIISFVNGNIGVGVAIGGAFALIRFRSAPGTADEIAGIFISMTAGVAFGMGYLAYGAIVLIGLAIIYDLLTMLHIFDHKSQKEEKLLRITIPESLEYNDVFKDVFDKYLKVCESIGVKTTGMGSMFRLSFKVKMKDPKDEKKMIDDIRILNGNLEIQLLPFTEKDTTL